MRMRMSDGVVVSSLVSGLVHTAVYALARSWSHVGERVPSS
jgi:hypothetical protein